MSILLGENFHIDDLKEDDTVLYLSYGGKTNYAFISRIQDGLYTLKNEKGKEFLFNIPAGRILRKVERDEKVPKKYQNCHLREAQMQLDI